MKNITILLLAIICFSTSRAADDEELVRWRNLSITQSDYESLINGIPERDRYAFQLSMRRITELLNSMLLTRTLADEARQLGIDKDPKLQKELSFAAEKILARRRLEVFEADLKVPDMTAVAEERYRLKPNDFSEPEAVKASHILIHTKTRTDAEALARAEEVRAKLVAGESIADLAPTYSEDPSAKNNQGNLGYFTRGRMAKPFEDAAFALAKPGEVSPVVKTQFGYHVIVLHERRSARQKPFSEVKPQLIAELTKSYIEKEKARYAESITTDKSIVLNQPAIDRLLKEAPRDER